ncbi:MAG: hypothetical protein CW338_11665, partial [Clostridiales bacterium]|nr:hypothetical protein [Clostridiales bacterium]
GDDLSAVELAKQYSISQSFSSSDRELCRLFQKKSMPDTGFYVAACNALAMGRWGSARAALDHYLDIAPDGEWAENADALQLNYEHQFYPAAGQCLNRGHIRQDLAYEALCAGDAGRADRWIRKMSPAPETDICAGAVLLLKGDPEGALPLLSGAAETCTEDFWALALSALAHLRCHNAADALSLLARALPLCGHMGQARLYCEICLEMHMYSFASDFCQEWIRQFPDSVDCLLMQLRLNTAMGFTEDIRSTKERIRQLDPEAEGPKPGRLFTKEQQAVRTFLLQYAHNDLKISGEEDAPRDGE